MTLNRNYRDIAVRAAKTFASIFLSFTAVAPDNVLTVVIMSLLTSLISVLMNLFNISPTSVLGRAASQFVQVFIMTVAANAYTLDEVTLIAAVSAGLTAAMNFIKEVKV